MELVDLLRHAEVHLDVVLLDALALEHGAKINQRDDRKSQDGGHDAEDVLVLLEKVFVHRVFI
jgi:hypothetical protein